jgi:hypothetical protein
MIDLGEKFVYIKVRTMLDAQYLEAGWPIIDITYFDKREDMLRDKDNYINNSRVKPKFVKEYHNDFMGFRREQWLLIFPDGSIVAYKEMGSLYEDRSIVKR